MNNRVKRIYLLIYESEVLIAATNLSSFLNKIMQEDIGIKISLSTLRNRFKEQARFPIPNRYGRVYWIQKIENNYKYIR